MLLGLAGGVALLLLALVLELLRRLVTRYRRGLFGTRLMARMAGSFVLMTVVPVALVFFVAVQFVGRSIESWFDVPLERALESGHAPDGVRIPSDLRLRAHWVKRYPNILELALTDPATAKRRSTADIYRIIKAVPELLGSP